MTARILESVFSLEREVVTLFGRATGADSFAVQTITVKTGSAKFAVGELVTAVGGPGGTGVVYAIRNEAGVWDGMTASGTCELDLKDVTGTLTADDVLTGDIAGAGVQDGAAAADTIFPDPTGVKGKGVASVVGDASVAGVGTQPLTITLENRWAGLINFEACVMDATSPDDWEVVVVSEAVATDRTIVVQLFKGGAPASLSSDEKLLFEITLSNSASNAHAGGGLAGY
jgi:hypothetical protein